MGFAAEGFGQTTSRRLTFAIGAVAVLGATVALVVWRTAEIKQLYPGVF